MKVVYTHEQKRKAIAVYRKTKSYAATIRQLGYPSRHVLFDWVRESRSIGRPKKRAYTPPKRYSYETKMEAVGKVMAGEPVRDVAEEFAMTSHAVLYEWVRIYRQKGQVGLMSRKERIEAGVYKTKAQLKKELPDDPEELKELAARLIAEKAVLEQELELAKKHPGRIPGKLRPKAKAAIVDSLRPRLPLALLLEVVGLPRSSYYYASVAARRPDKYAHVRDAIREISEASMHTYGSPRIWLSLRRRDVFVSEKVVRRLMKEEGVEVRYAKRKRRYSSYIGEITPAVDDLVKRKFRAESPNELWLTDITEFSAADGKLYLSPVIDCFDGKVVSWAVSDSPDNSLVERMIDEAIAVLRKEGGRPVVHTDRGGHYRGGMWIEKLEGQNMKRSMSRKGNSGDNAACEGFFGRMKTEMYHGIRWETKAALRGAIERYMAFYNEERIKASLGGLSIKEHRDKLAKVSSI